MPGYTPVDHQSPTEPAFRHTSRPSQSNVPYSDQPMQPYSDHQRMSSTSSQAQAQNYDEAGNVQRGNVGAGYGPYAYTMPSGQTRDSQLSGSGPGPSRFPSKESSSSFDSMSMSKAGAAAVGGGAVAGRHNLSYEQGAPATPRQDSTTTTFLLWDNGKDELDDALHTPDPKGKSDTHHWDPFSLRGWINALAIFVLLAGLIVLFAGWPIIVWYDNHTASNGGNTAGFNLGGINATGQVPKLPDFASLIDKDTPAGVMSRTGFDGMQYELVFSDEFNTDGRTFYPGDDPFWEAVDLHYWPTGDFEWYDPGQITTANGHLVIEMREQETHGLDYRSGMLQSWNKFCFSQNAYIEVSVSLPGNTAVGGFWPGAWTMGNLGRPGYGATTDGTWPYSYDACDIGTLANQTWVNGTGPPAALTTGSNNGPLSFLPGQRWSACTCRGEDHPGPSTNKGRGSPEIDILEAQINIRDAIGEVSQSLQTAPFDDFYQHDNTSNFVEEYYPAEMQPNTYLGGVYQQAVSTLVNTDRANYRSNGGGFGVYGFEYTANPNARDDGYVTWVSSGKPSWTMRAGATGPNPRTQISQRPVPEEPMTIILNFGMSNNFQAVDFDNLIFPNYMFIDYVRVYQRTDMINIGCNPDDYPTSDYINKHPEAYNNRNLTTWDLYLDTPQGSSYRWPKNSMIDTC